MKALIFTLAIVLCAGMAQAADVTVAWDWTQGDGEMADGFIIYFTDGTHQWNKTIADPNARQWVTPEETFPPGVELTFTGTAYNEWGESARCEPVLWTRAAAAYMPPADNLPSPTVVEPPAGFVIDSLSITYVPIP